MRDFEVGDIVYLRSFDSETGDWCIVTQFPYVIIDIGKHVKIMGGKFSELIMVPAVHLVSDKDIRMFNPCKGCEEK